MTIFDYNYQPFISVLLCYLNLSIPMRIKEQLPYFAQENNRLKDSGSCSKMTSSCNCPIRVTLYYSKQSKLVEFIRLSVRVKLNPG